MTATLQEGVIPPGTDASKRLVLVNDGARRASFIATFDLESLQQRVTPLARLQLGAVVRLDGRPEKEPKREHGVLHVFVAPPGGPPSEPVASLPVWPLGTTRAYAFDVTAAVNATLARASAGRQLRLEVRLTGKPLRDEIYTLPASQPWLDVFPATGWTDDWARRVTAIPPTGPIYQEPCLPLAPAPNSDVVLQLLYPVKTVHEVIANVTGTAMDEGRDWVVRDGKLVLPSGSRAPIKLTQRFFAVPGWTLKDGTIITLPGQVHLGPTARWYHQQQIVVTYEPAARPWSLPAPRSSPGALPRFHARLTARAPLTVIVFGDSIAAGTNASRLLGVWPYQPGFAELVAHALKRADSAVKLLNHSRLGESAMHAVTQADAQVAWFQPDLVIIALGMNDRTSGRRVRYRANIEAIIHSVRARSPKTEFVVVTPMLNNPRAAGGVAAVESIRDQALSLARPGIAVVDMTTTVSAILEHKSYLDLSGNGLCHPNDFLQRLYAQRLLEVLAPPAQTLATRELPPLAHHAMMDSPGPGRSGQLSAD